MLCIGDLPRLTSKNTTQYVLLTAFPASEENLQYVIEQIPSKM